jgi:hypothetical protein
MIAKTALLGTVLAGAAFCADQATLDKGKKEEARSCIPCHSLRLVHSQRLSRAAWNRELDKMSNWGAKITDRESLLEYLVATYGDDKPLPQADTSGDGSGKK